jgi:type II secretion system protein H
LGWKSAFTLIELILVMTILTIMVSITAPALSNFFRGRSLDSEARRLLALTRLGQNRAVSEGLPMELWIDSAQNTFGLEAEPSYSTVDTNAVDGTLDKDVHLEALSVNTLNTVDASSMASTLSSASASTAPVISNHPNLPRIRFLPDGTISETSPQTLRLTGRDGGLMWLVQSRNRLSYEIRNRVN